MAVNQKHITIASHNYLLEMSAIPYDIRINYLEKLKQRKNASSQKNVKLLECINEYIDSNQMSEWDPHYVSKLTGITYNALYTQKSRLHKNLREHFFGWKEKQKEIIQQHKDEIKADGFYIEGEQTIKLGLAKARKMAEIGMLREAKCAYSRLEKPLRKLYFNNTGMYVILSEIYEFLGYYYYNKRSRRKVMYYHSKMLKLNEMAKMVSFPEQKQADLISIKNNFAQFYADMIEWYSNPRLKITRENLDNIYELSLRSREDNSALKVLHIKGVLEIMQENYKEAAPLCKEGYDIALRSKNITARYTFASMNHFLKLKQHPENNFSNEHILKYYYRIKEENPFGLWTIFLENSIVVTYFPEKRKDILEIFNEQIKSNIMYGDLMFAVYYKFMQNMEMYADEMLTYFDIYNIGYRGYLEIKKVDNKLLDNIKQICANIECYHKKINDFGLSWLVYKLKLTSYFFREDGFDYDEITALLKELEHMKKVSKNISGLKTYELLKLCFKMIDHRGGNRSMLKKFEQKFVKCLDEFKKDSESLTITDYMIVSSLARRLRCKEITSFIKNFYHWIETEHNSILAPVNREIKQITPKYTIISPETAA